MISKTTRSDQTAFTHRVQGTAVQHAIPLSICRAYNISLTARVSHLRGGRVNTSFLIEDGRKRVILQKLSNSFSVETMAAATALGQHLIASGWEAPIYIPTQQGAPCIKDATGTHWRQQQFLTSDNLVPQTYDKLLLEHMGDLLGSWHRDVSRLTQIPAFPQPNFHDTAHHALKLHGHLPGLHNKAVKRLAVELLDMYACVPPMPAAPPQVIHADPKSDNMLFRGGRPFTLIDLDNIMIGSPWIDVGDSLRSIMTRQISAGRTTTIDGFTAFVAAYRQAAGLRISSRDTVLRALDSTHYIAVELGMRYLCDIVDKNYFLWDSEQYRSRTEHHLARAELQLAAAKRAKALKLLAK
jgi:Ser/Thr protein kinase RdoA (MazF antagonist)